MYVVLKECFRVFIQRKLSTSLQYLTEKRIGRVSSPKTPSYLTEGVEKKEEEPEETTNHTKGIVVVNRRKPLPLSYLTGSVFAGSELVDEARKPKARI